MIQLEIDRDTLQVLELLNNKVTTSGILCIALAPGENKEVARLLVIGL